MDRDKLVRLSDMIRTSERIVFFGGAGVSTESGIPDFRSADGIYSEKYRQTFSPEEIISHTFYERFPELFFSFYKEKLIYPEARPNACHEVLAALEKEGKMLAVVTQNIDGLHQAAGSRKVFELHGSTLRNYCGHCGKFYTAKDILKADKVPSCTDCGGRIKPDVVLYEESLDDAVVNGAVEAIKKADMLIIGGTSLSVYPAAGLIRFFRGKYLVLLNKSVTSADSDADLCIHEPIGEVMKAMYAIYKSE